MGNQLEEVINLLIELLSTFMEANDTIAQIDTADAKEKNNEYSNIIDQAEGLFIRKRRRSIKYYNFPKIKGTCST